MDKIQLSNRKTIFSGVVLQNFSSVYRKSFHHFCRLRGIFICLIVFPLFACNSSDEIKAPKGFMNETTLKIAYATGLLKLIDAEPPVPESLSFYEDIVYKQTPEKELKLDIYHQNSLQEPQPLLVFIHGGSWKSGNKDDYRRYLVDFAEKGYVTASLSYRFAQDAPFPAAFDDVVCGLSWLRQHAEEYMIDADHIAVVGGSAGGHLTMMLAYHSYDSTYHRPDGCEYGSDQRIQAIVNFYGPTDLTTEYARNHPSVFKFIGQEYSEDNHSLFAAASPLEFVSEDDPPTLTFHGTLDDLVPVSQADRLHEALKESGVQSEYHRLKGWPHTMDLSLKVNRFCQYQMDAFFEKYLREGE
ncbi:MAG: alpha/beta hydrolase [Bacteroidetes bacterium]|nr:alpha/beta hydrolase [Bacteroidota bacterium]MCB0843402.1 alpha/beta hydrolase [Bacteroidota bacterium]